MCVSMVYIYNISNTINLRVVVLADFPHRHNGTSILVGLHRVQVVERPRVRRSSITGSEVYAYSEVDLTAAHDEVKEGINCLLLQYK